MSEDIDPADKADLDAELEAANARELSPAEIAAWARDYLNAIGGNPPGNLTTSLLNAANIDQRLWERARDKDCRVLRQIAETFERLCIVTGGRHFATDLSGTVNLPPDHIRRMVAHDLADQIAPMLRIEEKSEGYRLRVYTAALTIVLPETPE
jgi:hypothetical protein